MAGPWENYQAIDAQAEAAPVEAAPTGATAEAPAGPWAKYADPKPVVSAAKPLGPASATGILPSLGEGIDRGMTFNLQDELGGALGAVQDFLTSRFTGNDFDWNTSYSKYLEKNRNRGKVIDEKHPIAAGIGEVVGSLPAVGLSKTPLAVAKASGVWPAVGRGLVNTGVGAGAGAASGFGAGEGGDDRAAGAGLGAVAGGAIGAVAPALVGAVSKLGKIAKNTFALGDPNDNATKLVLRAFHDDGYTIDQAISRAQQWQAQGAKPEALLDIGGRNVTGLMRGVSALPGEAKNKIGEIIQQRMLGQQDRIASDLDKELFGAATKLGQDYLPVVKALDGIRRKNAAPLYDASYQVKIAPTPYIMDIVENDPIVRGSMRKAVETAMRDARSAGKPAELVDFGIQGFDAAGNPIMISSFPNMRLLDAVKKNIDNEIEQFRNPMTGKLDVKGNYGRSLVDMQRKFVEDLDDMNPVYKQAREAWAGPSKGMDALALGRNIFEKDSELTAENVAKMSKFDKLMFKIGAKNAILNRFGDVVDESDAVKVMFNTPNKRKALREAFDDDASFDRFASNMGRESNMYTHGRASNPAAGSSSIPLAAEIRKLEPGLIKGFLEKWAMGANWKYASTAPLAQWVNKVHTGVNPKIAGELTRQLAESDPALRSMILQQLKAAELKATQRSPARLKLPAISAAGNLVGGMTGP